MLIYTLTDDSALRIPIWGFTKYLCYELDFNLKTYSFYELFFSSISF